MNNFQIIVLAAIANFPGVVFAQETAEAVPAAMVADGGAYAAVSLAPTVNAAPVPPAPSSTTISSDGTTATDIQNQGNDWQIDGGTLAGSNLFHNFDSFSLASGDSAVWSFSFGDPASITNVINRVTGGAPSLIDGAIDSTALPNADFFFLNPAGIVMHENAQVDVGASAHFSTASELGFSDGTILSVATPTGSTFSMATPDKLGFFGTEAALSVLSGATPIKPNTGSGLHLSGTDVAIDGLEVDATFFTAIASGSAQSTVNLAPQSWTGQTDSGGDLSADRLDLLIGSGGIVFDGKNVLLSNSEILTITNGETANGDITIRGRDNITIEETLIRTQSSGVETSGDITLIANDIVSDGSGFSARGNLGDAGNVTFEAGGFLGISNSFLDSISFDEQSGEITLVADYVSLVRTFIDSNAFGRGSLPQDAGPILIVARDANIQDSGLFSAGFVGPSRTNGGSISLNIENTASITNTQIFSQGLNGNGGDITISARELTIEDSPDQLGTITTSATGFGAAGVIDGATAGNIRLQAENITIGEGVVITSEGYVSADGGIVMLAASEVLKIGKDTQISSKISRLSPIQPQLNPSILPRAEAGEVSLQGKLVQIDGATVESTVLQSTTGTSGSITIEGKKVELTGGAIVTATNFGPNSGADTGGSVRISSNLLELRNGSEVSTNSINGPAGDIVFEIEDTATISKSTVSSSSPFGGRGGAITISAAQLLVEPGSNLTTSAGGIGSTGVIDDAAAGDIRLQAEIITIGDEVLIASEGDQGADGGSVTLTARKKLQIAGKDTLVSSRIRGSLPATAGQLTLQGRQVQIDGATIASTVAEFANGTSGSVTIEGEQVLLNDAASVTAANFGQNSGADTGGSVRISGNFIELRNGSIISTNSTNGPAGDIFFSLPDDGLLRLVGGDNGSSVITTSSGPGTGGVIAIAEPLAIISQGGDILALGDAGGANVRIIADFYIDSADTLDRIEVDGDLTFEGDLDFTAMGEEQRDPGLLDAGAILSGRCLAAFASGETSQLSIIRPGPYGLPIGEAAQSDTIDELAMDTRARRSCG